VKIELSGAKEKWKGFHKGQFCSRIEVYKLGFDKGV